MPNLGVEPWSEFGFFALLPDEWAEFCAAMDLPRYRGKQIFHWLQQKRVLDPQQMKNLPVNVRALLSEVLGGTAMVLSQRHTSPDDTQKLLLSTHDDKRVETVLIPELIDHKLVDNESARAASPYPYTRPVTQCISSQVGCALGCTFCASGVAGLQRHLSASEIVYQVLFGAQTLRETDEAYTLRLRNVVYMGMGEPLHNYDALSRSLKLLLHKDGLALSKRRVTVSTSGLVPEIDKLGKEFSGQIQLAISLHAPDDDTRSALMPVNKKYPIKELMAALRRYPLAPRRRITIEYILIDGVNDSPQQATQLAKLLASIRAKVNLIPMNPVAGASFRAPTPARVERFARSLREANISSFVRATRGDAIDAACGQLALRQADGKKSPRTRRLPQLST